jgi:5-carboxymethyl-2-hydroxymuconate isomerase
MPHISVDFSPNLEARLDVAGLCGLLRDAAAATGLFPEAGIRVRAFAAAYWVVANGDPQHAFLDISIRLRAGRSLEARKQAVAKIFSAVEDYCRPVMESSSLMLSLEMRDIDPELGPKASSIRRYLPGGST